MPPVMGAAAFLMAEMIGITYAEVALAALVPALLYILALMVSVRLEAGRLGLQPDTEAGWQLLKETLKSKKLFTPTTSRVGWAHDLRQVSDSSGSDGYCCRLSH
ncbi:TRAP transporter large permease subunit [Vibrio ostreae]|uniref:TRAP transporter large permease subunit n=1 Tax=Vibrio ostreae TaxID=2841925 RepID=UPI0021146221|nr:TRAP transporter large permease subunit [Vibrio ostreae]